MPIILNVTNRSYLASAVLVDGASTPLHSAGNVSANITLNGTGVTWYGENASAQCNSTGTHYYAAIGIPGSPTIITFTVDGVSYRAEYGMNWNTWVESDYNVDGFIVSGTDIKPNDHDWYLAKSGVLVSNTATIEDGTAYEWF